MDIVGALVALKKQTSLWLNSGGMQDEFTRRLRAYTLIALLFTTHIIRLLLNVPCTAQQWLPPSEFRQ